jgi:nucleotide-binding universal stress UspA family protein
LTVARYVIDRGIDVRIEILEGHRPAEVIATAAEREDADLVCIASRGRSRLPRLLLGSVSQEMLLRSKRPVLVIP